MPIDPRRRNALDTLLVQTLRGGSFHNIRTQLSPILDRGPKPDNPGFPVLTAEAPTPDPLDDPVLDELIAPILWMRLPALWSSKVATQELTWNLLKRTLAFLRSDLDVPALRFPNPRPAAASWTLPIIITPFSLLTTLFISIVGHPLFALLWPLTGIFLFWKTNAFRRRRRPPAADPFLTIDQWHQAESLIAPNEIPPFNPAHFPSPVRPNRSWTVYLLLPLLFVLSAVGIAVAIVVTSIIWPLILRDHLRQLDRQKGRRF